MHIIALDHIVLEVADVERSVAFYSLLGLEPERLDAYRRHEVKFPSMRVSSDTVIDLFPPPMHAASDARGSDLNHFALVSDLPIDAIRERLEACSIEIEEEADNNYGARGLARSLYVRDPDGNRVEIRSYVG
jgi:catechol 2,3-dioxygenase-like lactoylglutathione lyase family enzyme